MENKDLMTVALFSFIGCLLALVVFACVAGIIALPLVDATISHAGERVLEEINSAEFACSEYYIEGSIPITIDDTTSYCVLKKR